MCFCDSSQNIIYLLLIVEVFNTRDMKSFLVGGSLVLLLENLLLP